MLTQANHWLEILVTAADILLLGRVLLLRLQRLYFFITLACLLSVFFDAVDLWLGVDSPEDIRVFLYSRFLYACVLPLIAWEVFEELKTQVSKLRRLAMGRLLSGLFFATLFGFLVSIYFQSGAANTEPGIMPTLALVIWAGSSTASLAFIWTLHRQTRALNIQRPNNTRVWVVFWELSLLASLLSCFSIILVNILQGKSAAILNLLFEIYGIGITAWCIFRLRPLPSGVPSAPANAV